MNDFAAFLRKAAEETEQLTARSSGFEEEPVSLTVFVQDRAYLGNPPLSLVQYDAVRHIERIYYNGWFRQDGLDTPVYVPERDTYRILAEQTETGRKAGTLHVGTHAVWREERYWSEPLRMINFATLQWGKGSGKDHIVRIASMRIAYLLMCLESPQEYYRMPEQDTIHLLNVASSSAQAQQAFFMPITRAVKRGWFKNRCAARQNVISYDKNVESISGHSDAESQEGLNLLLGIADEVDAFRSRTELAKRRGINPREPSKSAESILEMMQSSGSTRFPEVFKQVRISFPRYLGSTIQQLTIQAKADFKENGIDSRHYVSGPLATWEVNPRVSGREAFSQDYKADPVMARSKYECKPSRSHNPYFRNPTVLDACFEDRTQMPILIDYRVETINKSQVWIPEYQFAPDFYPVRGAQYAMHGDLAVAGDRAGVAMAHVAHWTEHPSMAEDEDGATWEITESRPHVKVDFVISYTSDISAKPPREIQIRWARQLCFELIRRGFNIRRFTFDGFQSMDSMQILETKGIQSERSSTDLTEDPWRTLRDLTSEQRIRIPRPAPVNGADPPRFLLREELLSLSRMPNGRINHPSDGSKDEADAVACAVVGALALGGQEEEGGERTYFAGAEFATGATFELPLTGGNRKIWENSLPSPLMF